MVPEAGLPRLAILGRGPAKAIGATAEGTRTTVRPLEPKSSASTISAIQAQASGASS